MEYCMRLLCEDIKECKTKPCKCDKLDGMDKCSFCIKKCKDGKRRIKGISHLFT